VGTVDNSVDGGLSFVVSNSVGAGVVSDGSPPGFEGWGACPGNGDDVDGNTSPLSESVDLLSVVVGWFSAVVGRSSAVVGWFSVVVDPSSVVVTVRSKGVALSLLLDALFWLGIAALL